MGRKKLPIWSLVAADTRSPRDGRFIEDLGRYFPLEDPARVELNEDRVLHWLETGAQPSDTVRNILSRQGLMLALHLKRKGKSDEEVRAAIEKFREDRASKTSASALTPTERRRRALDEERERVRKEEEEQAKLRAQAEEKQRQEAERAKKEAAESRVAAAEAARKAQEAANEETAGEEAGSTEEPAAAPPNEPDEVPANEPAPAKETGEDTATEEAVADDEKDSKDE